MRFNKKGLVAMANTEANKNSSGFFITLSDREMEYLNSKHTIFGIVAEGLDTLDKINVAYCDNNYKPY